MNNTTSTSKDFRFLSTDQLKVVAKGIMHRYVQMYCYVDFFVVRGLIFHQAIHDYLKNAAIDSFVVHLRSLLEFFNPDSEYESGKKWISNKANASQFFKNDQNKTADEYKYLCNAWENNFSKNNWEVAYEDNQNITRPICFQELERYINALLMHQGIWNEKQLKALRLKSLKIDWPTLPLLINIMEIFVSFDNEVKKIKPESLDFKYWIEESQKLKPNLEYLLKIQKAVEKKTKKDSQSGRQ